MREKIITGMKRTFLASVLLVFALAVLLIPIGLVSAQSFSSSFVATSSYTTDSSSSIFSSFSSDQCKTGQDFVLQVSPMGCVPSVVRSDLLEEQNVPVFCRPYQNY